MDTSRWRCLNAWLHVHSIYVGIVDKIRTSDRWRKKNRFRFLLDSHRLTIPFANYNLSLWQCFLILVNSIICRTDCLIFVRYGLTIVS